jgi:hypothetical protein
MKGHRMLRVTQFPGILYVENEAGAKIEIEDFGLEGIKVHNVSAKHQTSYRSKKSTDTIVFGDANPKSFWKDFDVLI